MPCELPTVEACGLPALMMELAGISTSRGSVSASDSGLPHPLLSLAAELSRKFRVNEALVGSWKLGGLELKLISSAFGIP
ncbi:MAG: hypothetical protein QXP20_01530 [Candidatus Bathyarchaeia archaeon]